MFKAGDYVKCIDGSVTMQLTAGKVYKITGVSGVDVKVNKEVDKDDWCLGRRFELVQQFDLKKNPWFIRTGTKEKSEAAQKWLFEQGVEWSLDSKTIRDYSEEYLTNTYTNGLLSDHLAHGIFGAHKSAKEIILEFETTVKSVTHPSIETEQDKKIKELKETIDKAQQQLEEMMSK